MANQQDGIMNLFGLGGLLGGGVAGPQALMSILGQRQQEMVGRELHRQLLDIAQLLSSSISRLGGPQLGTAEQLPTPSMQPFVPEEWIRHVRQLAEEVAWRSGVPLPRRKELG